jgi:hypothetical protein
VHTIDLTIWLQVEETSELQISGSELRSRFSRDYVKKFVFLTRASNFD